MSQSASESVSQLEFALVSGSEFQSVSRLASELGSL